MIKICENCDFHHDGKYGSGRFCSEKCAKSFSTKKNRKQISKKVSEKLKGISTHYFNKDRPVYYCKFCKSTDVPDMRYKICNICLKWISHYKFYCKIGIVKENDDRNLSDINDIAIELMKDMYFNKNLSTTDIQKITGCFPYTLQLFFRKNNLNFRSLSDSGLIASAQGKLISHGGKTVYKSGWHTTWEGRQVYYRSSYELIYAKYLDFNRIEYDVESLRIQYYDSVLQKYRTSIPDFYIPSKNLIVEIKSKFTYNKLNMDDKIKAYEKLGYNFELLLDNDIKNKMLA